MWPTKRQVPDEQPFDGDEEEDQEAIAWPTKAANSKVTFNNKKKSGKEAVNSKDANNRGNRGQRQSHRYNQTDELAAVMNFMNDSGDPPQQQIT